MPCPYLHGNGAPCPDCAGGGAGAVTLAAGAMSDLFGRFWPEVDIRAACGTCKGTGRVRKPVSLIVCEVVAQARANANNRYVRFGAKNTLARMDGEND